MTPQSPDVFSNHQLVSQNDAPFRSELLGGDQLLGSTVGRFPGNAFYLNSEGDLGVVVVLANNQIQFLRYQTSNLAAAPRNLLLRGFTNLYNISPTQGAEQRLI